MEAIMAKQKSTEPAKRIPAGTRVQWRARYPTDPLNEGMVKKFDARTLCYYVDVDKTPTGKSRKRVLHMHPFASRLEAQNPDALK
jgi:hypothetical protein